MIGLAPSILWDLRGTVLGGGGGEKPTAIETHAWHCPGNGKQIHVEGMEDCVKIEEKEGKKGKSWGEWGE